MKLKIALIFSIFSLTAINAFSVERFSCKDYPVANGNPFAPPRTVRICGVGGHESAPSYFSTAADIENRENRLVQSLYGRDAVWPIPEFQRSQIAPSLNSWQSYNKELEPILKSPSPPPSFSDMFGAFKGIVSSSHNPSYHNNNKDLVSRDLIEVVQHPLQGQQLVEDISEVKNSVKGLVSYLKNILDNLLAQKTKEEREENVNVNIKLDPSFEAILKQFLQLAEQSSVKSTEKSDEQSTTESIEDIEGSHEYFGSFPSEEITTENSSDENTTEQHEESSTEENSTEEDHKLEDFDGWFSDHFGPSVNKRDSDEEIEEMFNQTNEEENSSEKSEESFETWFNTVYRRFTTEAPNEYNKSEEKMIDSKESNEKPKHESNENSKSEENSSIENEYKENTISQAYDYIDKSSEEKDLSNVNTDNSDERNYYDAIFVPTTMNTLQQDSKVEYLENGNRYSYGNINVAKPHEMNWECVRLTLSVKNFDDKDLWRVVDKCLKEMASKKRKASETLAVYESKESAETDSNESKDSSETPRADSDESKESGETESAVTDSSELKESNEIESTITDSSENFAYQNDDYYG